MHYDASLCALVIGLLFLCHNFLQILTFAVLHKHNVKGKIKYTCEKEAPFETVFKIFGKRS
jgi:hypothetical protein